MEMEDKDLVFVFHFSFSLFPFSFRDAVAPRSNSLITKTIPERRKISVFFLYSPPSRLLSRLCAESDKVCWTLSHASRIAKNTTNHESRSWCATTLLGGGLSLEHATPHTASTGTSTPPIVAPIAGGMAGASIGLGFFSCCVFWWYPFSPILSSVGLILGLIGLCRGVKGPRGENFALGGTLLCATSLSLTITLNFVLRYLQWDSLF